MNRLRLSDKERSESTHCITISHKKDMNQFKTKALYHSNHFGTFFGVCQVISTSLETFIGELIRMEVKLVDIDLSLDATFSIEYDSESWAIDGPKTGIAKVHFKYT